MGIFRKLFRNKNKKTETIIDPDSPQNEDFDLTEGENPSRFEFIQEAVRMLENHFEVPYPFLCLINDSDDCLYFQLEDCLSTAKNKDLNSLQNILQKLITSILVHV